MQMTDLLSCRGLFQTQPAAIKKSYQTLHQPAYDYEHGIIYKAQLGDWKRN